ncbi:hypothetical protein pEaSNUABM37_00204 [Erwinia phage pEa_SNUABM_37]|nr:hypothetical protein pEaSNUABM37_00204 [Erwinia phage pEa_SNUABM_37]QXO10674.1 hypothetical protein pEaSNUABM48_00204 [Erwinia phage pEa_SNUABM_48]
MSLRDPMRWLREQQPGANYDTITLRIRHGVNGRKIHQVEGFGRHKVHSYNAVLDWLEKSPVYVWPYADAEHGTGDSRQITVTLRIDAAVMTAASSVDGETILYDLAESVSRTLTALSDHVYLNTRGTIFIDIPK